ncbi:hypothetical protein ONZ45_g6249 [Pleurotus djamor]|nr:hypothetical protein ONZ45_g6249 [Pleurotus djamor]
MAVFAGFDFNVLIGPLFIGIILNWFLLGILVIQFYNYFKDGYNDNIIIKLMVVVVMILDALQTVFTTHLCWALLVESWGHPEAVFSPPWSAATLPIMSGLISGIVQFFFAWRILRLKSNWITRGIVALICLVALMQAIAAIVGSVKVAISGNLASPSELFSYFTIWLVGSFVDDFIIAITMYTILAFAVRSTISKETGSHVQRIMYLTVQTGAITAAAALVELILFLHFKSNNLHNVPALLLGKLYSNVMLASLNSRRSTSGTSTSENSNSFSLGNIRSRRTAALGVDSTRSNPHGIMTTTEQAIVYSPGTYADMKYGATQEDEFTRSSDKATAIV